MRWDSLFDDLESQLDAELVAEDADLAAEEERLRIGRLSLRARIAAAVTAEPRRTLTLHLIGDRTLRLRAETLGRDWISGEDVSAERVHPVVIPLSAIEGVSWPVSVIAATVREPVANEAVSARLGFAFVLRDLCRRRSLVRVVAGSTVVTGTIDRVGRDHLDVAEHDPDAVRRRSEVTAVRSVPFASIAVVHYRR